MNVLSLFDGMSCGRVALERCGFKIDNYFAAEIDKYAIQVALNNYPDTIPIGDVTKVRGADLPKIDLLIGGSPCQGFSFAGKQLNFEDPRSKLFFEFVRLLEETKPTYFFLENVAMKKEYQDVISSYLGVEPVMLNSALVSAQNRKRLYWTNIPGYTVPEDKGILLKDIVHEHVDLSEYRVSDAALENEKYVNAHTIKGLKLKNAKSGCLTATCSKGFGNDGTTVVLETLNEYIVPFDKTLQILDKEVERGKVGYFRKDSQANRVYYIHDKAVTLCGDAGGGAAKMGQYLFGDVRCVTTRRTEQAKIDRRENFKKTGADTGKFSEREYVTRTDGKTGALTTVLKDNYLFGCTTPDRLNKNQNGQRFNSGTKFYTLTAQDRHGILIEGYIRKLTPIECERLQTLPDNYTAGVSNSQRYKMLGNGWTVDAVVEFFKHIPVNDLDLF